MSDYRKFIETKSQMGDQSGFEPLFMPDFLFDLANMMKANLPLVISPSNHGTDTRL
jgi:hypothetical protein